MSDTLPPELVQAQEHLTEAAKLVSSSTAKYLNARGLVRELEPLSQALQYIRSANSQIGFTKLADVLEEKDRERARERQG